MGVRLLISFFLLLLVGCTSEDVNDLPMAANTLPLGVSAHDLLSDEKFTSLKIDLVYVDGFEPSPLALKNLKEFLQKHTHKPQGIHISRRAIRSPGGGTYEIEDIVAIEKENRILYNSGDELAIFILFADGEKVSEDEDKVVLGSAYRNTSIVIFEESIQEMVGKAGIVTLSSVESTTLQHEFGHLFGLVNNGSPSQNDHEDPENESHCDVDNCLMTATFRFGAGIMNFIKSHRSSDSDVVFDKHCLLDLRANGGK